MRTILVTGGAGFLGSHLCDRLLHEGFAVVAMDNLLTGTTDNVAHLSGRPDFRFIHHDVTDYIYLDGPLFAVLHEPIYCQGSGAHWSAERIRAEYPEFAFEPGQPFSFTGEMIYPWLFEEDCALRPLKEVAEILAQQADWPHLYDADRLRANCVPCAAVIYADDMYVERAFSEETARLIGCRYWLTNEYQHNGLRADGAAVLGRQPDPQGQRTWAQTAQQRGLNAVAEALLNSQEYTNNFGDWEVPGSGGVTFCAPANASANNSQPAGQVSQVTEPRFRGMDRNDDGVITRNEWRGNARSFNVHDWDGNGVLEGNEVRAGAFRRGGSRS